MCWLKLHEDDWVGGVQDVMYLEGWNTQIVLSLSLSLAVFFTHQEKNFNFEKSHLDFTLFYSAHPHFIWVLLCVNYFHISFSLVEKFLILYFMLNLHFFKKIKAIYLVFVDMACFQGLFFCPDATSLLLHNFCIYHIDAPGHEVSMDISLNSACIFFFQYCFAFW